MAEELDGFELSLLDAYREATAPDPAVEDALLARVLAEVRGEGLDEEGADAGEVEAKPQPARDARALTSTAIAITAFAAGVALTWGLRGSVLQPMPSNAPSSAPMQYGDDDRARPYVDTASLPTCVDRSADDAIDGSMQDLGSDEEPIEEPPSWDPDEDSREPDGDDAGEPSEPSERSVPAGQAEPIDDDVERRWSGSSQVVAMMPVGERNDENERGRRKSTVRGSGGWSRWTGGTPSGPSRTRTPSGPGDGNPPGQQPGRPTGKPPRGDSPNPREPSPEPPPDPSPPNPGPADPGPDQPPGPPPKPPEPTPKPEPPDPTDPGPDGETGEPPEEVPPDAQCEYELQACYENVEAFCMERPSPQLCMELRYSDCQYSYETCLQGGYPPDYDPCMEYIEACFQEADYQCSSYPEDEQACADAHGYCEALIEECYAAYEEIPEDPAGQLVDEADHEP